MAKYYLDEVQTPQPQGPYQLAGWSFGGLIAFEMASQLQTQGESFSLLALLDTPVSSSTQEHQGPEVDAKLLVDLFAEEEIFLSLEHQWQLTPDEQLNHVIEQVKKVNLFPSDVDLAQVQCLMQVFKTSTDVAGCYKPHSYLGKKAAERGEEMSLEHDSG